MSRGQDNLHAVALDVFAARFDAAAKAACLAVGSYRSADEFQFQVTKMAEEEIAIASGWCPDFLNRKELLDDLHAS
jgi:hypothetical protein